MLRVLHTSDWHLGHTLHDLSRWREHDAFLSWLMDLLGSERIDALLITGDIFDSANPSATASSRWFSFLATVRARYPRLDVVVIGGNHDSAARLDAPRPILESMNIHIVGGLPRTPSGAVDYDNLILPLHDASGAVAAWVAAVPFLRPGDLPRPASDSTADADATVAADAEADAEAEVEAASVEGRLIAGMRRLYGQVLEVLRGRCAPGQAQVVTGHCLMQGAVLSEQSERKIQGGNHDALPLSVFPEDVAYVALGHLHLPQAVGRETVRYAGAPLPLSMAEGGYDHQVRVVTLDGGRVVEQASHRAPRVVGMLRVPADGPAAVEDVLAQIAQLPPQTKAMDEETLPFLEVRVVLEQPVPGLRRLVQEAVQDRAARLVKLSVTFRGTGEALADTTLVERLRDIQPEEVFVRRYQRDHDGEPPPELMASFHELVDQVMQERGR